MLSLGATHPAAGPPPAMPPRPVLPDTAPRAALLGPQGSFWLAAFGVFLATGMDGVVKHLSADFGTLQIVWMRFALMAVLIAPVLLVWRLRLPGRAALWAHLGRAGLMLATTAMFFFALGRLPLVDVFVLSFTAPVFTAIFGAVFLGERVARATWGAIALALCGMAVVLFGRGEAPGGGAPDLPAYAAALGAPVTYALGIVLLRFQTLRESLPVIVFTQSAMIALVLAVPVGIAGIWPAPGDWGAIAALGLLSVCGYMAFAAGLRGLTAARFAVVEYTGLIWATLIGIAVFDEIPALSFWPGALLVLAGCYLAARQRAPD